MADRYTYRQTTGDLLDKGDRVATCYAGGNGGLNPEGVNNPALQYASNVGPLPQGRYVVGDLHSAAIDGINFDARFGPTYRRLKQVNEEQMHGRSGMLMHWDRADRATRPQSGSHGCICPWDGNIIAQLVAGEILEVVE